MAQKNMAFQSFYPIYVRFLLTSIYAISMVACSSKEGKENVSFKQLTPITSEIRTAIPITQVQVKQTSFPKEVWTEYTSLDTSGMAVSSVWDISVGPEGIVWAATSKGVSRFDGNVWRTYTTEDGLPDNKTSAVAVDQQGIVWVGSDSGKIASFDGASWTVYPSFGHRITSILIDKKGTKWFGSSTGSEIGQGDKDGGILRFDGIAWKIYRTPDGLFSNNVWALAEDTNGDLWCGAGMGVSFFDGKTWSSFSPDVFGFHGVGSVSALTIDKKGAIWFAAQTRIYQYKSGVWTNYDTEPLYSGNLGISSLAVTKDNTLWIATSPGKENAVSFSAYDGTYWLVFENPPFGWIFDIEQDMNGDMWFATARGVARFKNR